MKGTTTPSTKAWICALATFLTPSFLFAQGAAQPGGPGVDVTKITDNIYLLVCSAQFTSNCVALVGEDGILLVDSGMPQTADSLKAGLEKLHKGPVKYLIHTHGHQDHTGANALLGKTAKIVAHYNFERDYRTGYGLLAELPKEAYPDVTFVDDRKLSFNGEEIELTHFAGGHDDDDTIVVFKESGVVCLGGLFSTGSFPYLDLNNGGDIKKHTNNIYKIIHMFPDDTKFVPSHGEVATKEDLKEFYKMLLETAAIVQKGLDEGKDVTAMQAEDVLAQWSSWGEGFVSKNYWIQTVANSLSGNVEPSKKLILEPLYYTLQKKDAAVAVAQYYKLKESNPEDYDFSEPVLNALGYYLLGKERYNDAIEILKLNIELFPESANPYDSLGEAYMRKGDKELAAKYYKKALAINPEMPSAIQALQQLEGE